MKKYFWIFLGSLAAIIIVEFISFRFSESAATFIIVFICLCIPLALILGLSILMGRSLSRRTKDNKLIPADFSFVFQTVISGSYIVFILYFFFHIVPSATPDASVKKVDDCHESNLNSLLLADQGLRHKYILAYISLKETLRENAANIADTAICLEQTLSQASDTVIDGNQMTTKITFTAHVAGKDDGTFRYTFCCNDSVGFPTCNYPFPNPYAH